ncbi:MAG TPA: hypothetical protein VFF54_00920 [Thermodesulfobacteriota bacterium]|nr:hypothetical protein [Thermodesulfobacteriota bacterium]
MKRTATTLRLSKERLTLLKIIACYRGKTLTDVFTKMADEYIRKNRNVIRLVNSPLFPKKCKKIIGCKGK